MTPGMVALFAVACGVSAANLYYAQPLLPQIARDLHAGSGRTALVVTSAQIGYGIGLALIVPLGDILIRRRLVPVILLVAAVALLAASVAPELADRYAVTMEDRVATVSLLLRPFEPEAHVSIEDRHPSAVAVFRFAGAQGDKFLLPVDLVPADREQLSTADAGKVGRHKQRSQVVRQRVSKRFVLLVREESLADMHFRHHGK